MSCKARSWISWPGIPLMMQPNREELLEHMTLLMFTRCRVPGRVVSAGPRKRAPRRRKIGADTISRMVMLVIATSSSSAPSTVSSAIGIDRQTIDHQVIHARRENAEPATLEDLEIAQLHVAAVLQADGLVAHAPGAAFGGIASFGAVVARQPFSPDAARPIDRNVVEVLAPDQAVVPVIVTIVLVGFPRLNRFRFVVAARLSLRQGI